MRIKFSLLLFLAQLVQGNQYVQFHKIHLSRAVSSAGKRLSVDPKVDPQSRKVVLTSCSWGPLGEQSHILVDELRCLRCLIAGCGTQCAGGPSGPMLNSLHNSCTSRTSTAVYASEIVVSHVPHLLDVLGAQLTCFSNCRGGLSRSRY